MTIGSATMTATDRHSRLRSRRYRARAGAKTGHLPARAVQSEWNELAWPLSVLIRTSYCVFFSHSSLTDIEGEIIMVRKYYRRNEPNISAEQCSD